MSRGELELEREVRRLPRSRPILGYFCALLLSLTAVSATTDTKASAKELVEAGRVSIEKGDFTAAVEYLSRAAEMIPDQPRLWALLGRALVVEGEYPAAVQALEQALVLERPEVGTLLNLGAAYWNLGQLERAEQAIRQAVELSGRAPLALHELARLLLWDGRFDEATTLLLEAVERQPSSIDLQHDLARALVRVGRIDDSISVFRRTAMLDPRNPEVYYGLGRALSQVGDRKAAAEVFAVYRRLYEEQQQWVRERGQFQARLDLGYELLREGRAAEAVEHFLNLGESTDVLLALSTAQTAAGDREEAIRSLERAVALDPARSDLRDRLRQARLGDESQP